MGEAAQMRTPDMQLFHDVFDSSPVWIAVENLDGQPLFVNPAFCSMLGFSEEELLRKHCADFSPSEDTAQDWELFQHLKAGLIDHYQLEKRYFRRDGSIGGDESVETVEVDNAVPGPVGKSGRESPACTAIIFVPATTASYRAVLSPRG